MDKKKNNEMEKTPKFIMNKEFASRMNWGGVTDKGYIKYLLPNGTVEKLPLSKK